MPSRTPEEWADKLIYELNFSAPELHKEKTVEILADLVAETICSETNVPWVLILFMRDLGQYPTKVSSFEFNSKEHCLGASVIIEAQLSQNFSPLKWFTICVPK